MYDLAFDSHFDSYSIDDAYYDAITAKLRQIQGQVQYSTLYKQYLSKTHTRRREWLSNNADLNLYGILQELPFMAGKEFVSSPGDDHL